MTEADFKLEPTAENEVDKDLDGFCLWYQEQCAIFDRGEQGLLAAVLVNYMKSHNLIELTAELGKTAMIVKGAKVEFGVAFDVQPKKPIFKGKRRDE